MRQDYQGQMTPGFIVDINSVMYSSGGQVDWANVDDAHLVENSTKMIKAGTVMSKLPSGQFVPRSNTAAVSATHIAFADMQSGDKSAAMTGWGMLLGGVFRSSHMPDKDNAAWDTWATELGDRFVFESLSETAVPDYEVTA